MVAEREALLAEIFNVFLGVSREGGVSWSEADVLDGYGSPEAQAAARAQDRDTSWQELLDDPKWNPYPETASEWCFLDAVGFRYYLPAGMVHAVRQGYSAIPFHLTLPETELRDYTLSKWALLSLPERLCVKRFLEYMGIVSVWQTAEFGEDEWLAALNSYWGRIPDESQ